MTSVQQRSRSLWQEQTSFPNFENLQESINANVCVVGAGITGLLTAYHLLKKGFSVVLLEKDALGVNETAHSTAHLSNALDDRYTQLRKWHGKEGAQKAYGSHTAAIDMLESLIHEEEISCDFLRLNGYLFLSEKDDLRTLQNELAAAHDAGFLEAHITVPAEAFFDAGSSICFPRQAQLDPVKLMKGLIEKILQKGGKIFTNTSAQKFQGGRTAFVETQLGHRVSCEHIVVATNVPVNDWMKIHLKEAAYRSYAVGLKIPKQKASSALYWDTEDPYHYVRFAEGTDTSHDVLIVGGQDRRVGEELNDSCHLQLQDWARRRLKVEGSVIASWSGQIIEPMDGLAFIGRNPGDEDNVYIATGDSGHGITHGAIASMILSELIATGTHPWASLYDPKRFNWKGMNNFITENFHTGIQYRDWVSTGDHRDVDDLLPGQGVVLSEGIHKIAVYKDSSGAVHRFSAVCTHLGGVVRWNDAEETWDCPCHGSRYNKLGEVINGPALANLSKDFTLSRRNKKERRQNSLDVE